jgi:hypothetical protein
MLAPSHTKDQLSPEARRAADTRLLEDLARLDRVQAPSAMERLEAEVGNERLSQLLLLMALWPEDEPLFGRSTPAQAA